DIAKHWGPSSLDVVIVSCLMHHMTSIQEWENFLSACNIVLKKGGILLFREPAPTLIIRFLHWMSRYKIFYFGFFKVRLESFIEEDSILQHFFKHWFKSYKELINRNGFKINKEVNWFVHRITVCEKQ
ncbi:MAG: methyltransferase domain-containing protein, partial [Candidatus Omnitrophica bacterium]|nr:methyltransferase domain-containing protein [Candidatus Omnitrophota bacterium]